MTASGKSSYAGAVENDQRCSKLTLDEVEVLVHQAGYLEKEEQLEGVDKGWIAAAHVRELPDFRPCNKHVCIILGRLSIVKNFERTAPDFTRYRRDALFASPEPGGKIAQLQLPERRIRL